MVQNNQLNYGKLQNKIQHDKFSLSLDVYISIRIRYTIMLRNDIVFFKKILDILQICINYIRLYTIIIINMILTVFNKYIQGEKDRF